MCEASAYLIQDGKEELVLEDKDALHKEGDTIKMMNLFRDQKLLDARIKVSSFVENKMVMQKAR